MSVQYEGESVGVCSRGVGGCAGGDARVCVCARKRVCVCVCVCVCVAEEGQINVNDVLLWGGYD